MPYREIHPGEIYHVYNRGTCSIDIFRDKRDYARFTAGLIKYSLACEVQLLMYCLMPNHFHLLLREPRNPTDGIAGISKTIQRLANSYSKYFSKKHGHSGVVFQGKYKAKIITDEIYLSGIREYILDNPVRKKLVSKREQWPYSYVNIGCWPTSGVELEWAHARI